MGKEANKVTGSLIFGNNLEEQEERTTPETLEMLNEFTKQVFSTDKVETRTELKDNQLLTFSICGAYAEEFGISVIPNVLKKYQIHAISKNRESRKEFTKLASSITGYSVEAEGRFKSIPDNLLGKS